MEIAVGTKLLVVKGGTIHVSGDDIRLKVGEIWDIVDSKVCGPQFRKLNKTGGSTCILNGQYVASVAVREGKVRVIDPAEPLAVEHDELRKRTGAR